MSFKVDKCSRMVTKRQKAIRSEGIALPGSIANIYDSHKYFGIPQENGNNEEDTRKPVIPNICRE